MEGMILQTPCGNECRCRYKFFLRTNVSMPKIKGLPFCISSLGVTGKSLFQSTDKDFCRTMPNHKHVHGYYSFVSCTYVKTLHREQVRSTFLGVVA